MNRRCCAIVCGKVGNGDYENRPCARPATHIEMGKQFCGWHSQTQQRARMEKRRRRRKDMTSLADKDDRPCA